MAGFVSLCVSIAVVLQGTPQIHVATEHVTDFHFVNWFVGFSLEGEACQCFEEPTPPTPILPPVFSFSYVAIPI